MREYARNHVVYLQRRSEDFADADRPVPKWSDLDHEAVQIVLGELNHLQHAYQAANETLRKHGLSSAGPTIRSGGNDIHVESETTTRLILLALGVMAGAFLREIIAIF